MFSRSSNSSPRRAEVWLNFGLVYVLWGSTYLAIRISDETIRPTVLGATRFAIAGLLMLLWCRIARRRIAVSREEALRLAVIGVLLLVGGNTTLAWAELRVPTGLAALIVAIVPLWVMVLDWLFYRERLASRGLAGIALGAAGMVVLLWPQLTAGGALGRRELAGAASLIGGSGCWALGSVLSRHWKLSVDPLVAAGYEMTFAGMFNCMLALAFGSFAQSTWAPRSIAAIAYLVVFGSWIGFSAFVWLLEHVPTSKVSTYAYVNPVIAVFLGWLVLHERVDRYVGAGTAIIVAAVALVTSAKVHRGAADEVRPLPACEQGAD